MRYLPSPKGLRSATPLGRGVAVGFNQVWSISHGKGPFYPEYVGAAVPYSISRCVITSYGLRFRFLRWVNIYPDLLAVTCAPIESGK